VGPGGLANLVGPGGLANLVGPGGLANLVGPGGLANLVGPGGLANLVGPGGLANLVGPGGLANLVGTGGLANLVGPGGLANLVGTGGLANLVGSGGLANLVGSGGLANLVGAGGLANIVGTGGLANLIGPGGLANLIGPGGLSNLLGPGGLSNLLGPGGLSGFLANGGLSQLFGSGGLSGFLGASDLNTFLANNNLNLNTLLGTDTNLNDLLSSADITALTGSSTGTLTPDQINQAVSVALGSLVAATALIDAAVAAGTNVAVGAGVSTVAATAGATVTLTATATSVAATVPATGAASTVVPTALSSTLTSALLNSQAFQKLLLSNPNILQSFFSEPAVFQALMTNPKLESQASSNPVSLVTFFNNQTIQTQLASPAEQSFVAAQVNASNPLVTNALLAANPTNLSSPVVQAIVQQFLTAAASNQMSMNVTLTGSGNEVVGGLFSNFTLGPNSLFTENISAAQLAVLNQAISNGVTNLSSFLGSVTASGGNNVFVGGVGANVTAQGGGNNNFVIEDPSYLGLSGSTVPSQLYNYGGTFTGSGGSDTYYFVGGGKSNYGFGNVTLNDPYNPQATQTLDFSNFQGGGINLNLSKSGTPQQVTSALNLSVPSGITKVIGSSGNDTITGNSLNDTIQGSAVDNPDPYAQSAVKSSTFNPQTQWVYLDFTDFTAPPTQYPNENVTFTALGAQPTMTANSSLTGTGAAINVATSTTGTASTSAVQAITFLGTITGGTFTLSFGSTATAPISWSSDPVALATNISNALNALIGTGSVKVASAPVAISETLHNGTGQYTSGPTLTGTVTAGSNLVTGLSSTAGLSVGEAISGAGITAGTTITGISATSITLSGNVAQSGTESLGFGDQNAILQRLQQIYAPFNTSGYQLIQFTLNPNVIPAGMPYETVYFDETAIGTDGKPFSGGQSNEIDYRNLNQNTSMEVDVNGVLGVGLGQVTDTDANWINLTATVTAHELGHTLGLRHEDAFGPLSFGISNPPGPNAYIPAYTGLVGAFTTDNHIITSPAAVGSSLLNAADPTDYFGEREAIKLAFISGGTVVDGTNAPLPTLSGTLTAGSNVVAISPDAAEAIAGITGTTGLFVGQAVSGTGIPANTFITNIGSGTITLSHNATVGGAQNLTFPNSTDDGPYAVGAAAQAAAAIYPQHETPSTAISAAPSTTTSVSAQPVSLYTLNVPNAIPSGFDAGQTLDVAAVDVLGKFQGHADFYSFQGSAGDLMNFQVLSNGLTRLVNSNDWIDPVVYVYGPDGKLVAWDDDQFEGPDSSIVDLTLPSTGKYTVEIDSYQDATQSGPVVNGDYELFMYRALNYNASSTTNGGTDTLIAGTGNETLIGGTGNTNFVLGPNATGNNTIVGGNGNNTLQATAAANLSDTWNIRGPSSGDINGQDSFSSIQNLVGGAQNDTFKFYNGGSIATNIDGGGGTNTLDYSNYAGNVTVDLPLQAASLVNGVAGNFAASHGNSIANIQNVTGSQGTDILVGDNNPNVLAVAPTNPGRSLLIGGTGADTLIGGGPDDILVAGSTEGTTANYEQNLPALNAVMAEWTSSDSYKNRVNAILNPSQANLNMLNGVPIVLAPNSNKPSTGTIVDNTTANTIVGGTGPGLDLIYYDVALTTVTNTLSSEKFVNLQGSRATNLSAAAGAIAYTPAQIRTAYGVNNLAYDGSGQTIAVVEAYNDPNIFQAVDAFDTQFGGATTGPSLYDQYGPAASFLTVLGQTGQLAAPLPATDPTGGWEAEEALDVEWAHALAPGAQIIVVEANSESLADLMASVATAARQPGVSVVSMSWGFPEGQAVLAQDEALYDRDLTTPAGHTPVTFVASTGDYGTNDPEYPSFSPNVVAVGGTSLYLNADNSYKNETGWGYFSSQFNAFIGSGGGASLYEPQPTYQAGVQSTGFRTTPDVSFVADPGTGAWIADSYNLPATNPWEVVGGTSLSAPAWAGLMALVDQGRVAAGEATLSSNGGVEVQQALYHLSAADFNAILSGTNGTYNAVAGYNLVTGLGTPVASRLVPDLIAYQQTSPANATVQAAGGASGYATGTANVFNVFNALSLRSHDADNSSPFLAVRSDAPTAMTHELAHTPDLGHGANSAPVVYSGSPAGAVPRALATVDPTLAGDGGASSLRTGGEGTFVAGVGAAGSSVLLVNTGVLAVYESNVGTRAGMPCPYLEGSYGGDVLVGGDGSDLILGGEGGDILVGGFGLDRSRADDGATVGGDPAPEVRDLHSRALLSVLDDWASGQSAWGRQLGSNADDTLGLEFRIARLQSGDAATSATPGIAADEGGAQNGDAPLGDSAGE
jgi:hypothetical protein